MRWKQKVMPHYTVKNKYLKSCYQLESENTVNTDCKNEECDDVNVYLESITKLVRHCYAQNSSPKTVHYDLSLDKLNYFLPVIRSV